MSQSKLHIVGTGAMGSLYAQIFVAAETRRYNRFRSFDGKGSALDRKNIEPCFLRQNLWVIATKSYDVMPALRQHGAAIRSDDWLMIVANGYWLKNWNDEFRHFEKNLILGVSTFGVRPKEPPGYEVVNPQSGTVTLGLMSGGVLPLESRPPWLRPSPDIMTMIRRKWLINTVINSIAAEGLYTRNIEVLSDLRFDAVLRDSWGLAQQLWDQGIGLDFEQSRSLVISVATQTGENCNSMVVDRQQGRRMEVDDLSGLVRDYPHFQHLFKLDERLQSLQPRV